MRRNISLYIGSRLADLSEESLVLLNYTFEDLKNPTIVKNSYSKTITLAGTKGNNALFGEIWRLDRQTDFGSGFSGLQFDATRKTPFTIYDEKNAVLMEGYCRLDAVERKGQMYQYKLSLFGGLGSFFYTLSYNEDGTKKSLADLTYLDLYGDRRSAFPLAEQITSFEGTLYDAWEWLEYRDSGIVDFPYWNIINFAPCYNGLPEKFDAKKAVVGESRRYFNIPTGWDSEGIYWGYRNGSALVSFENAHTEWEVNDLRWYLQRPVFSIKALFEAITDKTNNGGYDVTLDPSFFNGENRVYEDGWLTLPLVKVEDRASEDCITHLLKSTKTPADYIISYAKMFGLVFVFDGDRKGIRILKRSSFFKDGVEDITGRVDSSSISLKPYVADHQFYQMGGAKPVLGEFAKDYRTDYGREYGVQRINTGYEFDLETKVLTDKTAFAEGAEVQERNRLFASDRWKVVDGVVRYNTRMPEYEKTTIKLWRLNSNENRDFDIPLSEGRVSYDIPTLHYVDWLPKLQLHEAEDKAVKGEDVLLIFGGMESTPTYSIDVHKRYFLSGDTDGMLELNGGTPCWNWATGIEVETLPSFRRSLVDAGVVTDSCDYGEPLARGIYGVTDEGRASIYERYWKDYLTDRYDVDAKVMRCKVDLSGMLIGQESLGRFYWYGGALWVLNRIEDYSLTTGDLTQCEFIKVKDKNNYR